MKIRHVVAMLCVAACSHGEPFAAPTQGTGQPFVSPAQLTYSAVSDTEPAWLPDGSGLLYSALRLDFPDTTFCIEQLPPGGGQAVRSWCPTAPRLPDSARAFQSPAVSRGGRMVYLRSARNRANTGWSVRQLIVTSLDGRETPHVILRSPFPYYTGVSHTGWLDETHFVFRADAYYIIHPGPGLPPIEADSGLFVMLADLSGDSAVFTPVPGTSGAQGVQADSGSVLYTLRGLTRVYRRSISTGIVDTLFNFGPGIPTDFAKSGSRLVANVDGQLIVADLAKGTTAALSTTDYMGLTLSPDAARLVGQLGGDIWELWVP